MPSLTLDSPAKINLNLHILGKRPDGYHELLTLFQRISLSDRMRFKTLPRGIRLHCSDPALPADASNLVWKAASLLQEHTGYRGGAEVRLEKRIPLASGMGGGSSNAATTLLALNRLWKLGLQRGELMALGRKLGADVPFFLLETSQALGRSRGDQLMEVPFSTKLSVSLTFLSVGLSTKSVYGRYKPDRRPVSLTKLSSDATMLSVFLACQNLEAVSVLLRNDLLKPAVQLRPLIGRVLSFLKTFSSASLMSGSGPTLFSLSASRKDAVSAAGKVSKKFGLKTWIGTTA